MNSPDNHPNRHIHSTIQQNILLQTLGYSDNRITNHRNLKTISHTHPCYSNRNQSTRYQQYTNIHSQQSLIIFLHLSTMQPFTRYTYIVKRVVSINKKVKKLIQTADWNIKSAFKAFLFRTIS